MQVENTAQTDSGYYVLAWSMHKSSEQQVISKVEAIKIANKLEKQGMMTAIVPADSYKASGVYVPEEDFIDAED